MDEPSALTAHGDAWAQLGRIHAGAGRGGGVARVRGARLMSSRLPDPAYNNADVLDGAEVDLDAVRQWYAERGVPWGARVPTGSDWKAGRYLFRKQLQALDPAAFVPAPDVPGLQIRPAVETDLRDIAAIDVAAFGGTEPNAAAWLGPILDASLSSSRARVALALLDGRPVATAYTIDTDEDAGPAAYLGGVGVVPPARRRGVAGAVSSWLTAAALADGARMVHCHPEHGEAARVYQRLGLRPAGAFDVYVDL